MKYPSRRKPSQTTVRSNVITLYQSSTTTLVVLLVLFLAGLIPTGAPPPDTSSGLSGNWGGQSPGDGGLRNQSGIAGKLIVLDPGHGGYDNGAVGPTGTREKDNTLAIAWELKIMLENAGAKVIMTRTGDYAPNPPETDLHERVRIAEAAGADLFVSIHNDANVNRSITGTTTYYYTSYWLAKLVQQELVKALGTRDIGVIPRAFYVLRKTSMPSILVEVAFISNWDEEKLLSSPWFRKKAATGIFNGLVKYFGG